MCSSVLIDDFIYLCVPQYWLIILFICVFLSIDWWFYLFVCSSVLIDDFIYLCVPQYWLMILFICVFLSIDWWFYLFVCSSVLIDDFIYLCVPQYWLMILFICVFLSIDWWFYLWMMKRFVVNVKSNLWCFLCVKTLLRYDPAPPANILQLVYKWLVFNWYVVAWWNKHIYYQSVGAVYCVYPIISTAPNRSTPPFLTAMCPWQNHWNCFTLQLNMLHFVQICFNKSYNNENL